MTPDPAHPDWAPYLDLKWAGTRNHAEAGPCFICEGRILVDDVLEAGHQGRLKVISVLATPQVAAELRVPEGTRLLVAEEKALSGLVGFPFHRGTLGCVAIPEDPPESRLAACDKLLVLPRLFNVDNLGALLRTAAALGVDGVLAGSGPGLWDRRTLRVSMGAAWKLPVWQREDPAALLEAWREAILGSEVVAAALTDQAEDARAWRPGPRTALVLGPEDRGLDEAWLARCDRTVAIPMATGVDSLNVSAAGAILMFRLMGG